MTIRPSRVVVLIAFMLLLIVHQTPAGSTITVDTTDPGVTNGQCSFQEAIYAAEFGANIALNQTDPDTTYSTGCAPGSGNGDTIVLQAGETYSFDKSWDGDAHNYMGPTATPIIFTSITIQGNGATLQWTDGGHAPENFRLFAVGTVPDSGPLAITVDGKTYSGTGSLTLQNVYVKGFHVKGGDGGVTNGGGGLGAGGAIYVDEGTLTVDDSTFENNGAVGGNGAGCPGCFPNPTEETLGGGGGGLSGNGGPWNGAGGGGGGARGGGGQGCGIECQTSSGGGGGGGTVFTGADGTTTGTTGGGGSDAGVGGAGGYLCGGNGGDAGNDGHGGKCKGGGGGGGGAVVNPSISSGCVGSCLGNGGTGSYGGGGGGGAADGGSGGFGGGGGGAGAGIVELSGGDGGFGGGGGGLQAVGQGSGGPGKGGPFGGHGGFYGGGGGGAVGGAIFNAGGSVTVRNSTFFNNYVDRGVAGGGDAANGGDSGGAIFSFNGSLIVQYSTVTANEAVATGTGGGIVFYTADLCNSGACLGANNVFTLDNTIIANTGAKECGNLGTPDDLVTLKVSGSGNLIMQNNPDNPCPGVGTTSDPELQSLQVNTPGNTPTMAILKDSPAADAGASTSSNADTPLPTRDQRGVGRPQPANGANDIGAYEARLPDFYFSDIASTSLNIGDTGSVPVQVNSFEYFTGDVTLSVPSASAGLMASLTDSLIDVGTNSFALSELDFALAPTVTPGSYTATVQGSASGFNQAPLMHNSTATVLVSATPGGMLKVISSFTATEDITPAGIATALDSKLNVVQTFVAAGDNQTALNVLDAFTYQVRAQSGKHISTGAATALMVDAQAVMTSVSSSLKPNPVMGSVLDSTGAGISTTVSLYDNAKHLIATASTDDTGFYYFPFTRLLTQGALYTIQVSAPKGYKKSTPASQTFTWLGDSVTLSTFVLN